MSSEKITSRTTEPDTLVMALLFLISRYAHDQDQSLIEPILDHFDWLANHPDMVNTQLQNTCLHLKENWQFKSVIKCQKHSSLSSIH